MNVVDTNVLSELMRTQPDLLVVAHLDQLAPELTFTTAITMAEIGYGIVRLPVGKRRTQLAVAAGILFDEVFADRILGFGVDCAAAYASICASRESAGRPIAAMDAMIASICRIHHAVLVTRNARDFELTGVTTINPWLP
jgi:toxin FitB